MATGIETRSPCVSVTGKIEIDEEILKHLQARCRRAERSLLRRGNHRHAPRRDRVRHRNHYAGASVLVGNDFGIDVKRLGEIGAHVRSRRFGCFLG